MNCYLKCDFVFILCCNIQYNLFIKNASLKCNEDDADVLFIDTFVPYNPTIVHVIFITL